MIEVRLVLQDAYERALFGQLMDVLEAKRADQAFGNVAGARPPQAKPAAETPPPPATDADVVVGHIQQNPETGAVESFRRVEVKTDEPKVSYADLEKAAHAHLRKHGIVETRKVIAPFGVKLDQVPEEKYAELLAVLEGAE